MTIGRGAVVLVQLNPVVGREHRGMPPCVVVSDPDVIGDQRFPLVCVVPVTGTPGDGLLYPALKPGKSSLAKRSFALIDHLRSIDKRRIRRVFGSLTWDELAVIDAPGGFPWPGRSARWKRLTGPLRPPGGA